MNKEELLETIKTLLFLESESTKAINFNGKISKKTQKEQNIQYKKIAKYLDIDAKEVAEKLNWDN